MGIFSKNGDHPDRKRDLSEMLRHVDEHEERQRPFVRERPRTLDTVASELKEAIETKKRLEQTLEDQNFLISKLAAETHELAEGRTTNLKEQLEHTQAILAAVAKVQEAGNEIANRAGHRGVAAALDLDHGERRVHDSEAGNQDGEGEQPNPERRTLQVQGRPQEEVLEGHVSRREKGPSYHENEPQNEPVHDSSWPKRHRLIAPPAPKEVQRD